MYAYVCTFCVHMCMQEEAIQQPMLSLMRRFLLSLNTDFCLLVLFHHFSFIENRFRSHTVSPPSTPLCSPPCPSHSGPLRFCLSLEKDRLPRDNN